MKKENAGLKSIQEAISRMAAGEVFYHKENCTFTMEQESKHSRVRFMLNKGDDIKGYWDYLEQWEVEVEAHWTDDVSKENHILCWVWDGDEDKGKIIGLVQSYQKGDRYSYLTEDDMYKHAEPVKAGEIKLYED